MIELLGDIQFYVNYMDCMSCAVSNRIGSDRICTNLVNVFGRQPVLVNCVLDKILLQNLLSVHS